MSEPRERETEPRITITELREGLPEILHRVLAAKSSFIVTKHRQPIARICPIADDEMREWVYGRSPQGGRKGANDAT